MQRVPHKRPTAFEEVRAGTAKTTASVGLKRPYGTFLCGITSAPSSFSAVQCSSVQFRIYAEWMAGHVVAGYSIQL